jgi:sensor domain CHASE-containing protein
VPQWSFQHTDEDSLQRAVDRVHEKIEPNEFQRIKGHFCAHWARRHALMDTFL